MVCLRESTARVYFSVWARPLCPRMPATVLVLALLLNRFVPQLWRATGEVIGNARESGQVKMKRKTFEMSIVSVFCQMEKAQMTTEY